MCVCVCYLGWNENTAELYQRLDDTVHRSLLFFYVNSLALASRDGEGGR